ncbi:thiamine pyrophosphate-binding protein [Campylobacter lanienae]|uniref:thiamine pyrophosphate-binding protein n=1 Tax=Campylobacter lanienae TaxID=75658 RepID=UPI0015D74DD1|nr:thiamine pyrophosphate-binding protein [Campylobacter lanienae]
MMKASDYIVSFLIEQNIPYVFGYIGGMVTHLVDSLYRLDQIEMVNAIQEQGAGFAADGYARVTGKVGVAITTSGPGATNLITPIADCFFDSIPAVFITGNVNTFEYRKYPNIRQTGFQETDIVSIVKPITKYAVMVDKIENLRYEFEKAFYLAQQGRKGPVLIDLPMNIQRSEFDFNNAKSFIAEKSENNTDIKIDNALDILKSANFPIILVGHGVRLSKATSYLRDFLQKQKIPVVESLLGLDSVPSNYEYNLGLIGTYGNRYSNIALTMSDVILVLGSRLDIRQIGADVSVFNNKTIIQVDIDEHELACDNLNKITINLSISDFFEKIKYKALNLNIKKWQDKVSELKRLYPSTKNIDGSVNIQNKIVNDLGEFLKSDDVICADVGQNQLWTAQSSVIKENTRFLTSGGLGSMGFALPSAIGAAISGKRAVVISGDGGFQMNIQELEVINRRKLPVKIVIMNNHGLGMVRQFQEAYFEGRNPSTIEDYSAPDFKQVALAYKIKAYNKKPEDLTSDFWSEFFADDSAGLVNVLLEQRTQIVPKVLYGHTIDDMHPFLTQEELDKVKRIK